MRRTDPVHMDINLIGIVRVKARSCMNSLGKKKQILYGMTLSWYSCIVAYCVVFFCHLVNSTYLFLLFSFNLAWFCGITLMTWNWPERIWSSLSFLLLDRIDSNFCQLEIWVYTLQKIKKILCISGDILTWRTPNRMIALPENGKKLYSWQYFFLLLDRINSNFGQFEIWIYILLLIKNFGKIICISGDFSGHVIARFWVLQVKISPLI